MVRRLRALFPVVCMLLIVALMAGSAYGKTYKVAFTSIPSLSDAPMEIAFEHMKALGYDLEPIYFETDVLAALALASGQVDIGMCIPFAAIQQGADLRIFCEGRGIEFAAVVPVEIQSWADMNGKEIYVHAAGSATLAQAQFVQEKYGIQFSRINFMPGGEVRYVALLNGQIDATFLDIATTQMVLEQAPGKFHVLPMGAADGSTESFCASRTFIARNATLIHDLIAELLKSNRRGNADYTYWVEEADKYQLLMDVPDRDQLAKLLRLNVTAGVFDPNGAITPELALGNFELYVAGEELVGPVESLNIYDYYDFEPLNAVLDELGRVSITVQF